MSGDFRFLLRNFEYASVSDVKLWLRVDPSVLLLFFFKISSEITLRHLQLTLHVC